MQTTGEKLKKARLEKNISFEEIYKHTKIHTRVLKALEEDRAHNFLSHIYVKNFLKAYARYLELDADALIKEYAKSLSPQEPEAKAPTKKGKLFANINKLFAVRVASVALLFIILVFYFRFALKRIEPEIIAVTPEITIEKVEKPVVVVPEKPKEALRKVKVTPIAPKIEELVVSVKTKENCWLKVDADEEVVFQKTLAKGKTEKWSAKDKIELRIGKPEALEVYFNGTLIDLVKEKVKKGLVITREGITGK